MGNRERIVFLGPDGHVAIINPVEPIQPPESVEEWLNRVASRAISVNPNLTGYVRVDTLDVDDFPTNRRFRNHWRFAEKKVHADRAGAMRQIMDEVRTARDVELEKSDEEKLKLDEIGSAKQKKDHAAYRQKLRDFPVVVETEIAGMNVEALEIYVPNFPEKPQ
jgi:hypothetical protein